MFFIKLVKPQHCSSRFRLIGFIAFLYFLCRTLAKRPIQKRDSLHFGEKNSSDIKLMDGDSSSNGCSCLARVLDASKFDDKLININYDNFPEYIFMTFFVDGLFIHTSDFKKVFRKERNCSSEESGADWFACFYDGKVSSRKHFYFSWKIVRSSEN